MNKYIAALFASCCANIAFATTWYVTVDAHNADYGETGETASGESWDAAITLTNAVAKAQAGDTILVEGGTYALTKGLVISAGITIRGGMLKGALSETINLENSVSTLNGRNTVQPIKLSNSSKVKFERIDLTQGKPRNLSMSASGDVEFVGCLIRNSVKQNGTSGQGGPAGGLFVGAIDEGGAYPELIFTDCVISNNTPAAVSGNSRTAYGYGVSFKNFSKVFINGCSFIANGVKDPPDNVRSGDGGSAIYTSSAPIVVNKTKFMGNQIVCGKYGTAQNTGVVRIMGSCDGSAFTNCAFVANCEKIGSQADGTADDFMGGTIRIDSQNNSDKIDFVNCTFAYNACVGRNSPAGINVVKGAANIINSIFFGSVTGQVNAASIGKYVHVGSSGSASIINCMFESEADISAVNATSLSTHKLKFEDPLFVYSLSQSRGLEEYAGKGIMSDTAMTNITRAVSFITDGTINVHLRGARGYLDENTGEFVKGYKGAENQSPAIDAGINVFEEFKERNGNKVNLGFYGNTPWATMSSGGFMIIIR